MADGKELPGQVSCNNEIVTFVPDSRLRLETSYAAKLTADIQDMAGNKTAEHAWEFKNGITVQASAAPEYKGKEYCIDPEEALVAAASSCHMLTFLAIASKKGFVVNQYTDQPIGYLEKNADGTMAVTRIELHPQIIFGGRQPSAQDIQKLHQSAHKACFIANSIRSTVEIK